MGETRGGRSAADAAAIWRADEDPIRIGVSSCLLGQKVRFDGGHKRDDFLTDQLAPFVEFVPVCPEAELGLGIPRESIHLVRRGGALHLVGTRSGTDHSDPMRRYAASRVRELEELELCGYVLKKGSPSCGLERVAIRTEKGMPEKKGQGLFASALIEALPELPVEEEGRLNDPHLRENWIERIFAYRRLRSLFASRWNVGALVRFHTAHKLQLMAHSPKHYASLGRLVAGAAERPRAELREHYAKEFMDALRHHATARRNVNVLQHVLGYFRRGLGTADREEVARLVDDYGRGLLPLIVPITLVRHHVARLGLSYLAGQVYLDPHPKELMLRNRV